MELGRKGKWLFLLGGLFVALPVAQAEQGGILILGIRQKNQFSERLGKAVEQRIERVGEPLASGKRPLSEADRTCQTQECLLKLAQSRKAAWVLGGEIREGGPRSYFISMWLFDVMGGRLLEEKGDCQGCDEAALGTEVASVTGKLLDKRQAPGRGEPGPALTPGPVTPPLVLPSPPVVTPPTAPVPTTSEQGGLAWNSRGRQEPAKHPIQYTGGRKIGAGVLGAVFLATLGQGILFSITNRTTTDGIDWRTRGPCPTDNARVCYYNNFLQLVGYSLAGVSLGGFVLTLTVP